MQNRFLPVLLSISLMVSAAPVYAEPDEMIVETAPITGTTQGTSIGYIDPDVIKLASSVRNVDDTEIKTWAVDAGITTENEDISETPCTWERFLGFLWQMNGAPMSGEAKFEKNEAERESASILDWAINAGLMDQERSETLMSEKMMKGNAIWLLWHMAGEPEPSTSNHSLPAGSHEKEELWACDTGLITREEQPSSDLSQTLTINDAVTYLYYSYHRRSESSFPITVDQFLASCQNVVDYARTHGYRYGSSSAFDPTTDGIISCDRLVAKALYDLGYTDQPRGGIVCSNADHYLSAWGFQRSTSMADAKRGSIMLVKHNGKDHTSHVFVCASDFDASMHCDRYDCGSNGFIQRQQPIPNLGFWYRTDDVIVYNIPE